MRSNYTQDSRGDFIRTPSARNVTAGEKVAFQCQHSTANGIEWKLNGTYLSIFTPPNTTVESVSLPDGDVYYSLMITAFLDYNETSIECVALFFDQDHQLVETMPVLLLIQGKLDGVNKLSRLMMSQNLSYVWQPSFSLDLTAVTPDVVYCLDVFVVTCGVRKHVISDCEITDNIYNYNFTYTNETLDTADLYEAIVTPRSNTESALNGTPVSITDHYITISDSHWDSIVQLDTESGNMTVQLTVDLNATVTERRNVIPNSFLVFFETIDQQGVGQHKMCTTYTSQFLPSKMTLKLPLDCLLPPRRVWLVKLHAGRCEEEKLSNKKELSTHDVQNIVVIGCATSVRDMNSMTRSVSVNGDFINGTSATGLLLILHSSNQADIDANYISMLTFHRPSFHIDFTGLRSEHTVTYNMSAFIVDENGLPLERAATLSQKVHFTSFMNTCVSPQVKQEPLITVQISTHPLANRNESCIHCTFQDKLISSCVAIIHEPASYLSKTNGLMSLNVIELDEKINMSTVSACLQDDELNVSYHIVTVFPFINGSIVGPSVVIQRRRQNNKTHDVELDPSFTLKIALSSAAGGVFVIMIILVIICFLTICYCKRKNESGEPNDPKSITMQRCDAYEEISLPGTHNIVFEENAAYAVISSAPR